MGNAVGLLVSISGLLAFFGTATLFLLRGRQQLRVETLENQAADLRNDVADRDRRITFCESELANAQARVRSLEEHVRVIEDVKLSEAYLTALESQLTGLRSGMHTEHDQIRAEIARASRELLEQLASISEGRAT